MPERACSAPEVVQAGASREDSNQSRGFFSARGLLEGSPGSMGAVKLVPDLLNTCVVCGLDERVGVSVCGSSELFLIALGFARRPRKCFFPIARGVVCSHGAQ